MKSLYFPNDTYDGKHPKGFLASREEAEENAEFRVSARPIPMMRWTNQEWREYLIHYGMLKGGSNR